MHNNAAVHTAVPQAAVTSGAGRRGAAGSHRLHLLFFEIAAAWI